MATGGNRKEGDDLIHPVEGDMCPLHPREELRLFCDQCRVPTCLECSGDGHDGHVNSLARKRSKEIMQHVQDISTKADEHKMAMEGVLLNFQDMRSDIEEEFQAALKKYNEDKKMCEASLDGAGKAVKSLGTLAKTASGITSSSPLSSIAKLKPQLDVVLQKCPSLSKADADKLRANCEPLVPTTPGSKLYTEGHVIVPLSYYLNWRGFIDGKTDIRPAPLRWPTQNKPLRWYDDSATDVAIIPAKDAAQLLKITGGSEHPVYGRVNFVAALMTPGRFGKAQYVHTCLYEADSMLGCWFMPCSLELGYAVATATGRRPRRLTGDRDQEFSLTQKCGAWRETYNSRLYFHY